MARLHVRSAGPPPRDDIAVLTLTGELDMDTENLLSDAAVMSRPAHVIHLALDCDRLDFCDSRGLTALLRLWHDTRDRGGQLVLVAPRPQLRYLLEITGSDTLFALAATVEEVLDRLPGARPVAPGPARPPVTPAP